MRTTILSITSSSQPHNYPAISESPAVDLQHALVIDFRKADVKRNNSIWSKFSTSSRTYSVFLHRLRSIVQRERNGQESPQIDTVHLFRSLRFPDERFWKLLEGLRPRHFVVQSSWDEECIMEPLEDLNWTLDSLTVAGGTGEGWDAPSKVIQYIPSLTLDYCFGLYFTPATDRSALRHLTITKNDAINMFNDLMEKFSVASDLQTLKLENALFYTFHLEKVQFPKILQQCTSLVSLDLAICKPLEVGYSENELSSGEQPEDEDSLENQSGEEGSDLGGSGSEDESLGISDEGSGEHLNDEGLENGQGNEGPEDEDLGDEESGEHLNDEGPENNGEGNEDLDDGRLTAEDSDIQNFLDVLPQSLPENLEHLRFRFRGPPKIVSNLSIWHQCAIQPSWMPNLKTLSFKLDIGVPPRGRTSSADAAKLQVDKFLSLLSESHPVVQIIH